MVDIVFLTVDFGNFANILNSSLNSAVSSRISKKCFYQRAFYNSTLHQPKKWFVKLFLCEILSEMLKIHIKKKRDLLSYCLQYNIKAFKFWTSSPAINMHLTYTKRWNVTPEKLIVFRPVWIMCGKRKITFSDRPFSIFIFAAFLHSRVAMVVFILR